MRLKRQAAGVELGLQLGDAGFERAAFDRNAELGNPQIQQLLIRPARPLVRRNHPFGLGPSCRGRGGGGTGSADIAGEPVYPGTGREPKSGPHLQFSRRCGIPERPHLTRSAYEFRVPCCRRRRDGCHALLAVAQAAPQAQGQPPATQPPAQTAPAGDASRRSLTSRPSSRTRSWSPARRPRRS